MTAVVRALGELRPRIGRGVFLAETCAVIGDVELGDEASVWYSAVVRGDVMPIRVGARTNLQDGAIVHATYQRFATAIGNDCTIGHGAIIHACTIEDRCLIGMGAILLNGAHVGTESIVAAGTLVVEEMKVPPRSLVMGSPGKVKRPLTDAEVESIQGYADRYVGYRLDYMGRPGG